MLASSSIHKDRKKRKGGPGDVYGKRVQVWGQDSIGPNTPGATDSGPIEPGQAAELRPMFGGRSDPILDAFHSRFWVVGRRGR